MLNIQFLVKLSNSFQTVMSISFETCETTLRQLLSFQISNLIKAFKQSQLKPNCSLFDCHRNSIRGIYLCVQLIKYVSILFPIDTVDQYFLCL